MEQQPNLGSESSRVFGLAGHEGETLLRTGQTAALQFEQHRILSGSNPLIAAANPLLNLVYQIRTLVHNPDPERLRSYLVQEVRAFEARSKAQGVPTDEVMAARYCLCTVLDETAAQTPWGGAGVWSKHSLLVIFHNETWGGEKFFQLLAKLSQSASMHIDLLEMMYYCISLGFEGRYKIVNNGRSQLESLRIRLAEIIHNNKNEYNRALSTNWRGTEIVPPKIWSVIPVWVSLLLALLASFVIFTLLTFKLADRSDLTFSAISQLEVPRSPVRQVQTGPATRFSMFLENEIRAGLVSVDEAPDYSRVTILGDGLYDSGSTIVRNRYLPVLDKIGKELDKVSGEILVSGHSDNVPIRTVRFPSNWHLSLERAKTIADNLSQHVVDSRRITAVGIADSEPVAPNDTPQSRALNRRVEITIFAAPSELNFEIK